MKDSVRFSIIILAGFLSGVLIFLPINELTSYYEYKETAGLTLWQFIYSQFVEAITLRTPVKLFFYLIFGGIIGGIVVLILRSYRRQNSMIFQLNEELGKNLSALIRSGESENLEFKSSFRYDYKLEKPNKTLEGVVVKTLAGFMNTRGGSLLLGVADDGTILGLERDYATLNRKDSDGYTQFITSVVSDKLGTHSCRLIRVLFHQVDGKEICRIIVLPSPVPIYADDERQSKFFIRTASGTREMDVQEAVTFIRERWK